MDDYGTNLGEKYATKVLEKYYETAIQDKVTNSDYEVLFNEGGASVVKVKSFGDLTMNIYVTGTAMTVEDPTESEGELDPDQQKGYYFRILSLNKFEDYIKNPETGYIARAVQQLKQGVDTYILGLYADAGSGNRVGTDYTTGTVTVTATTGECVGVGTTWTSAMAGLGFKATGHTKWYRIVAHATHAISSTSMYIQNDSDDDTSSYDGGAIAGAAYTIEAAAVKTVTTSNIVDYIDQLAEKLDETETPKDNRWLVVNAKIAHLIRRSDGFTPPVESAYQDVVKRGLIGMISGFNVYENQQVSGNNTTGYYIMAGHISAITFFMEYKETGIEDLVGDFGKAYKGLVVYGAKILDERRKALAYLWCKV
jgi:hypothetical protein